MPAKADGRKGDRAAALGKGRRTAMAAIFDFARCKTQREGLKRLVGPGKLGQNLPWRLRLEAEAGAGVGAGAEAEVGVKVEVKVEANSGLRTQGGAEYGARAGLMS